MYRLLFPCQHPLVCIEMKLVAEVGTQGTCVTPPFRANNLRPSLLAPSSSFFSATFFRERLLREGQQVTNDDVLDKIGRTLPYLRV